MSSVSYRSARLPFSIRPAVLALALPLALVCHTAHADDTVVHFAGTVTQDAAGNTTALLNGAGTNLSYSGADYYQYGREDATITVKTDATSSPVSTRVYGIYGTDDGTNSDTKWLTLKGTSVNIDTQASFQSAAMGFSSAQAAGIALDSGNTGSVYLNLSNPQDDLPEMPVGTLTIRTETTGTEGTNFTDAHTRSSTYGIVARGNWSSVFTYLNRAEITAVSNVSGWAQGVAQEGAGQISLYTTDAMCISAVGDVRSTGVTASAFQREDGWSAGGSVYMTSDGSLSISAESKSDDAHAHGVVALDGGNISLQSDGDLSISAVNQKTGVTAGVYSLSADSRIDINSQSGLSISATEAGNLANALVADGGSISVFGWNADKTSVISGHVLAANEGNVYISLGKCNITGRMDNFDAEADDSRQYRTAHTDSAYSRATAGTLSLMLGEGSVWNMTGDSWLSGLTASECTIRLNDSTVDNAYRTLTARSFYGSDNVFVMRAALTEENASNLALDQLVLMNPILTPDFEVDIPMPNAIIEVIPPPEVLPFPDFDNFTHKNKVQVVLDSAPASDDAKIVAINPTVINQSSIEYDFETLGGYVDGSTDRWVLRFAADESDLNTADPVNDLGTSGTEGAWYLVRTRAESTPETEIADSVGTSKGSYLTWRKELETLRDRLGEVRNGGLDGGWVKLDLDKARTSAAAGLSFRSRDISLSMGADRRVYQTPTDKVLAGGAFMMGNTDFNADHARGDMQHFSFKSYATWLRDNGGYVDGVLQAGMYKNSLKGRSNSGLHNAEGNYTTGGFGASVEVGHKFAFARSAGANWFVEPQTQLSYFFLKGSDYTLSTGMKVSQSNAHYLTGRAGGTFGYESAQGIAGTPDFSRKQFAVRTGVNHDFAGKQTVETGDIRNSLDTTGTSFYYGVEANYQKGPANFFLNVERETGNRFSRDISITAGLRVSI